MAAKVRITVVVVVMISVLLLFMYPPTFIQIEFDEEDQNNSRIQQHAVPDTTPNEKDLKPHTPFPSLSPSILDIIKPINPTITTAKATPTPTAKTNPSPTPKPTPKATVTPSSAPTQNPTVKEFKPAKILSPSPSPSPTPATTRPPVVGRTPNPKAKPHLYTYDQLVTFEKSCVFPAGEVASAHGFIWNHGTMSYKGQNMSRVDEIFMSSGDHMKSEPITFISVTMGEKEVGCNLLKSAAFKLFGSRHQWLVFNNEKNEFTVTQLYEIGRNLSKNDLMIFLHGDVWLGPGWLPKFYEQEHWITTQIDQEWGVLGSIGFSIKLSMVGQYCDFGMLHCGSFQKIGTTLNSFDEHLVVFRKKSKLSWDPNLPNNHIYGTDIVLKASSLDYKSYGLFLPVFHKWRRSDGKMKGQADWDAFLKTYSENTKKEMSDAAHYLFLKWKGKGVLPTCNAFMRLSETEVSIY